MLINIFSPTITFALTAGPTSPEFSSFEPVDTIDLVDLATGDLTYNIPLLEIPSPEGGYPLSLSYHAGIKLDQEASWVGLGWALSPGAINRQVNLFPDDINAGTENVRDIWIGGTTTSNSFGIGIGVYQFGLTTTTDTYKGTRTGSNSAMRIGPISIGGGTSGFGDSYQSIGISMYGFNAGVIKTYNTEGSDLSAYGGISAGPLSISIGSGQKGLSVSAFGIHNNSVNDNKDKLTIENQSFGITIPAYYFTVSYNYSKTRYFLDQFDHTIMYGSLYGHTIPRSDLSKVSFDSYSLKKITDNTSPYESDPDKEMGGSLPAFDQYVVTGQGIGGAIQPYIFESPQIFRRVDSEKGVDFDYSTKPIHNKTGFRFINDFSNSLETELPTSLFSIDNILNNLSTKVGFEKNEYNNYSSDPSNYPGLDISRGILSGSRHIEWFTNKEINDRIASVSGGVNLLNGFIPDFLNRPSSFQPLGYNLALENNIGGFMITNESGVTYHYSLPAYSYDEYSKYANPFKGTSREIEKYTPYAYMWHLTAITGPDFVDRGVIGSLDDEDWGYWVKFEYGKWTDQFQWRNPAVGTHVDIDSDNTFFSYGKKEIYYLDAVKTRTHTALFVKDIRNDCKGVSNKVSGGFDINIIPEFKIKQFPISTLKLNRILLFENATLKSKLSEKYNSVGSLDELKSLNNTLQHSTTFPGHLVNYTYHIGKNVLNEGDLTSNLKSANSSIAADAIREISFLYSTGEGELCKFTPNSKSIDYNSFTVLQENTGKLTLKGIEVKGLGGESIAPPTNFFYNKNPNYVQDAKDIWGYYKSDFNPTDKDYIHQLRTASSKDNVDAWSLTKIETPLGTNMEITYSSDMYGSSIFTPIKNFKIRNIEKIGSSNSIKIYPYSPESLLNIPGLDIGSTVKINSIISCEFSIASEANDFNAIVTGKGSDYIIVESLSIASSFNSLSCPNSDAIKICNGGNLFFQLNSGSVLYGGGLKVASVSINADNVSNQAIYEYSNGVIPFEPINTGTYFKDLNFRDLNDYGEELETSQKNIVSNYYTSLVSCASFLPPPDVNYSTVTLRNNTVHSSSSFTGIIPGESYTKFEFSTYGIGLFPKEEGNTYFINGGTVKTQQFRFFDLRNRIGLLEKVEVYNSSNNLIGKRELTYLHDLFPDLNEYKSKVAEFFNSQGRIDQLFLERRTIDDSENQFMTTEVEEIPVILLKDFAIDKNGVTYTNQTLSFDFYSGQVTSSLSSDAIGNNYISEFIPAHVNYPAMGIKAKNRANRHMLSQTGGVRVYKVNKISEPAYNLDGFDKTGLVSASYTEWNNNIPILTSSGHISQSNIWRKKAEYSFIGNNNAVLNNDGTYSKTSFDLNQNPIQNNLWEKLYENKTLNVYSKEIEVKDIYSRTSSILYDPELKYILASASNADNTEIAYSGFEFKELYSESNSLNEGNVIFNGADVVFERTYAHTGNYSLRINNNKEGLKFRFTPKANKAYVASVWVYLPGTAEGYSESDFNNSLNNVSLIARKVNLTSDTKVLAEEHRKESLKARSYYLLKIAIPPLTTPEEIEIVCKNNSASRPVFFDDFQVHPINSDFNSFVYNPSTTLLTHVIDKNNFYSRLEYDVMGNLTRTFREYLTYPSETIISESILNYGQLNK